MFTFFLRFTSSDIIFHFPYQRSSTCDMFQVGTIRQAMITIEPRVFNSNNIGKCDPGV